MNDQQTLEELEQLLDALREDNTTVPIIVEGDKDIAALRKLELKGEIIRFNKGQSVSDFCDDIAQKHQKIILLTDWDWRGGRLGSSIKKHLENRVECNITYRQMFAKRCMCRTVEGIPSWLETLQRKTKGM
ncbi:MAG TPA: topoisomerase [Thermoplasmatales archaeon]|nr:topoisomerase [Thermoplasmatales archaeon]